MLSTLFVAAVIIMILFANIYYSHQCLKCMPVIGSYYLICMLVIGLYYLISYVSRTCI